MISISQQAVNHRPAKRRFSVIYGQHKNRDGPLIFHRRDGPRFVTGPPGGTGPPPDSGTPRQGQVNGTGPPQYGLLNGQGSP